MIIEHTWHKATYSKGETNCVECATTTVGGAAVRDTQHRHLGQAFPRAEWRASLESAKARQL